MAKQISFETVEKRAVRTVSKRIVKDKQKAMDFIFGKIDSLDGAVVVENDFIRDEKGRAISTRNGLTTPEFLLSSDGTKKCKCCNETKTASEFYKQNGNVDGLKTLCKTCYDADRIKQCEIKTAAQQANKDKNAEFCCRECGKVKHYSQFRELLQTSTGFAVRCLECESIIAKKRYHKKVNDDKCITLS